MKTYIYGFQNNDIEAIKVSLEESLKIKFIPHESLYLGGDYYRYNNEQKEVFILRKNIDLPDNEPAELEYSKFDILLYIQNSPRNKEIEKLIKNNSIQVYFLE